MKTEMKAVLLIASLFAVATAGLALFDESEGATGYSTTVTYTDENGVTTEYIITEDEYENPWVTSTSMVFDINNEKIQFETWATLNYQGTDYTYKAKDIPSIGVKIAGEGATDIKLASFGDIRLKDDTPMTDDGKYFVILDAIPISINTTYKGTPFLKPYIEIPVVIKKYSIEDLVVPNWYTFDGNEKYFDFTLDFSDEKMNKFPADLRSEAMKLTKNDIVTITGDISGVFAGTYNITLALAKDSYFGGCTKEWTIDPKNLGDKHDVNGGHNSKLPQYPDITVETAPLYFGQKATVDNVTLNYPCDYSMDSDYSALNPIASSSKCNPVPFEYSEKKYGGYTVTEKKGTRTADQVTVVIKGIGNFTGKVEVVIPIVPVNISEYTLHVDTIHTDGTMNSGTFDDSNVFLFAIDKEFPTFSRENFQVVVLNARGGTVIDETAGINYGKTASEWNYIEIHGINGFEGVVTGYFYEAFDGATAGVIFNDAGTKVIGYDGESADVVIPATNNGLKVTKIADKAFYNNKTIESVVIGDNVVQVGMKAFANCVNLKSVVFGDSVKIVYSYAFFGCKSLEMLDFGFNLTSVKLKAFDSVSIQDASGNDVDATAANLKGCTFEGSKRVLKLVA